MFFRRQAAHRQRMQQFGFEMLAQYRIHTLLALHPTQSFKNRADNQRLEMPTIPLDGKVRAIKARADPNFDLFCC